jgi:hypothetical protein
MSLFEYLAIAFSLVLSTEAMRIVGGLPHGVDGAKRYWVRLGAVAITPFQNRNNVLYVLVLSRRGLEPPQILARPDRTRCPVLTRHNDSFRRSG